jgi:hypothetical protein
MVQMIKARCNICKKLKPIRRLISGICYKCREDMFNKYGKATTITDNI